MSTLTSGGFPTLAEIAGRLDPNGDAAMIANVLSKKNPLLRVWPWAEGNLPTGHRITQTATSLPTGTWRTMNTGVPATKGKTIQYDESCGRLEDESKIDEAEAELNGGAAWRASEDAIKLEALPIQFATALFYESVVTNPERIHGLAARYPATSGYTSSSYVLVGTNAGTNAHSVWLLTPALRKLYGVYPKGTQAGLQRINNGRQRVLDSNSYAFYAWCTQFVWRMGIAVEDYRYAVRGQWDPDDANMDVSERGLVNMMRDMMSTIYETTGDSVFVMNRTSMMRLNAQLSSNNQNLLQYVAEHNRLVGDGASLGQARIPTFMGIPILLSDALVAETAIS